MKRCKKCNSPLLDGAEYCRNCGALTEDVPEAAVQLSPVKSASAYAPDDGKSIQRDRCSHANASGKRGRRKRKKRMAVLLILLAALVLIGVALLLILPNACAKTHVQSRPAYPAALSGEAGDGGENASQPSEPDASSARAEMPDLTGQPIAQAEAALVQMDLVVERITGDYDAAKPDGAVLTQSKPAGEWTLPGDHVTLTYNALPLTLSVFNFAPRECRITLSNLIEVCKLFDTTNPTFSFSILIDAEEIYELKGGFRCLTGADEETPISRVNTQLLREGKVIKGLEADNAYDDSIGWTVAFEDWTGFHFDHIKGYEVAITSRADETLRHTRSYTIDETKSMTLLDCGFDGGRVRMDVTGQKQCIIRLTDDALQTGYTNSPQGKGDAVPYWTLKLPVDSYRWISITVDGTNGQAIDEMLVSAQRFLHTKSTAKGEKPAGFDGVNYTIEGDTLVLAVTVPEDADFSVYDIAWLELETGNGAATFKTRIR